MRHSTLVRLAGLAAIALAAACSDAPTAGQATVAVESEFGLSNVMHTQNFDIVPGRSTFVEYDGNYFYIQADALCAVGSSYGRAFFDLPCEPEMKKVSVTAQFGTDSKGRPALAFNKDLRFSPTKFAYVVLSVPKKTADKGSAILWYDPDLKKWVDEGAYDPSQRTYWHPNGKMVWRRLKHFSGYNIGAGECDPAIDPTCGAEIPPPPIN